MAAPIIPLQVVQAGVESTRGTAVTATSVVDFTPGSATLAREPNVIRVRNAGSLATSHRSYAGKDVISVDLSGPVTYDRLPFWLVGALGTATISGATAVTYTFGTATISDTSDNLKSYTLEVGGKDTWPGEFKIAGACLTNLTISGNQADAWQYKATLIGTSISTASKTAALSQATLVDVLGQSTKVYVDTSSAFGTTQKTGTVLSFEVGIDVGVEQRYTLDGQRNPYRIAVVAPRKVTAKIVAEFDTINDYNSTHAATAQRVRIVATGPTLGASNYKAQLDIAGTFDSMVWGNDNGVITEELTLTGQYDTSLAADLGALVVCSLAALP